jgi:hypothetical protein
MTIIRDTITETLDIGRIIFREGGLERQRRSIIQPRVGACAYPGSTAQESSTLKGLHHRNKSSSLKRSLVGGTSQSARGLANSKTPAQMSVVFAVAKRPGVRRPSAAFAPANPTTLN